MSSPNVSLREASFFSLTLSLSLSLFILLFLSAVRVDSTLYVSTGSYPCKFGQLNPQTGAFSPQFTFSDSLLDGVYWLGAVNSHRMIFSWFMQSKDGGLRLADVYLNEQNYTLSPPGLCKRNNVLVSMIGNVINDNS